MRGDRANDRMICAALRIRTPISTHVNTLLRRQVRLRTRRTTISFFDSAPAANL